MNTYKRRVSKTVYVRVSESKNIRSEKFQNNNELIEIEENDEYDAEILNIEENEYNAKIIDSNSSRTHKKNITKITENIDIQENSSSQNKNNFSFEESKRSNSIVSKMVQMCSENKLSKEELDRLKTTISKIMDEKSNSGSNSHQTSSHQNHSNSQINDPNSNIIKCYLT